MLYRLSSQSLLFEPSICLLFGLGGVELKMAGINPVNLLWLFWFLGGVSGLVFDMLSVSFPSLYSDEELILHLYDVLLVSSLQVGQNHGISEACSCLYSSSDLFRQFLFTQLLHWSQNIAFNFGPQFFKQGSLAFELDAWEWLFGCWELLVCLFDWLYFTGGLLGCLFFSGEFVMVWENGLGSAKWPLGFNDVQECKLLVKF